MTTRRAILALGFGAVFAPLIGAGRAWAGNWVDLGSRRVRVNGEADRIMVADDAVLIRQLRLAVAGNDIHLRRATVHFANGKSATYAFDALVAQGTVSSVIDLPGQGRAIRHVDLAYHRPKNGRGWAVVTLQGFTA